MPSSDQVPRRPFGSRTNNDRLPDSLPIVGIGGSSFSHFMWTKEEADQLTSSSSSWTQESVDRSHPRVKEWIATMKTAVDEYGITLVDTAPWYGHGVSEIVIGWAMDELSTKREQLTINTKVGRYEADPARQFDFSRATTIGSVKRSLQRMKCQYIDVLQLHDPEFAPDLDEILRETIPALMYCRDQGWCRALGMTGYPLSVQYQILQRTLEEYGSTSVWDQALSYGHYNLHDTSLFHRPIATHPSFADFCHQHKIALMAAAPLSMKLLTHIKEPPKWHPASPELRQACQEAAAICESHGVDIATIAIVFAFSKSDISCTILGMKNVDELKFVTALVRRFQAIEDKLATLNQDAIMKLVLTDTEYKAWVSIKDPNRGPFASLWKTGTYDWDGIQEAKSFWDKFEGKPQPNWHFVP